MLINNLADVKQLIQNNIELFRLHNYMSANPGDVAVCQVAQAARFNHRRIVWFTEINSLYSSIVVVKEYMQSQGHSPNSLDQNFSLASWNIASASQHNVNNVVDTQPVTIDIILRRMRNSIGHGKFQITRIGSSATQWLATFKDDDRRRPNASDQFFELNIVAVQLHLFLEQLERCFNRRYP